MIYAFSAAGLARLSAIVTSNALLAFDIDGTLAPLVARPEEVRLSEDVQRCLGTLALRSDVAIITGRSVDDARRMLAFEPRYVIGNHGAEGLPGWGERSLAFARIVQGWTAALGRCGDLVTAGVRIEEKRYSLSLHYRGASDREAARRAIHRCVDALAPAPRVIEGKAVVNLLPAQAPDKGDALRELIEVTHSRYALYVGDDVTDEAVFALELPGVVTVRIEPSAASRAALFLHDQGEVLALMRQIARQ